MSSSDRARQLKRKAADSAASHTEQQHDGAIPAPVEEAMSPGRLTAPDLIRLQRVVGNHAIGRLLDQSSPHGLPATEQQGGGMADRTLQREVDTTSSPSLPTYGKDEVPGWQRDQGVPDWAKEGATRG